jgi:type II secretory pathway component PulF
MSRISTKTLIQLCRRVGTSMRAGVEPRRLWETEARHATGALKRSIERVKDGVLRGETVADSMRACEGYFPPLVTEMVEVGEKTGQVDAVFLKLADHFDHQSQMTRNFLMGIALPVFELCFAVFIIGGLMAVMGWITDSRGGQRIDLLGIGLTGTTGTMVIWGGFAFLAAVAIALIFATSRGYLGPRPVMLAMKVPYVGGALESMALSRLTWALAMGLDAGIDAKRSVSLAFRASQNPYFLSREETATNEISLNRQFYEAFAAAEVFPREFLQNLETAEIAGATTESLQSMARDYESRARHAIKVLSIVLGLAIMIGVLMLVGLVVIVMFYNLVVRPVNELLDLKPGTI